MTQSPVRIAYENWSYLAQFIEINAVVELCIPVEDQTLPVIVLFKDEDSEVDMTFAVSCSV